MKKLLYFILFVLALVIISYFVVLNLPKASSANKEASQKLSATELMTQFESNEAKANKALIGKTIEVSGQISDIEKDKQDATVVYLETGSMMTPILCTMEKSSKKKFNIGDQVRIKGQCNGFLQGVLMNKCVLVD